MNSVEVIPASFVRSHRKAFVVVAAWVVLASVVGLGAGAMSISPHNVMYALLQSLGAADEVPEMRAVVAVVTDIRLPRVLLALLVGAALSMGGAVLQGLFRNPLADPGLIGVSTGAALFVALTIVGIHFAPASMTPFLSSLGSSLQPLAACFGGCVATFAVVALSRRAGSTQMGTLLLAGVAINAFCASGIGFLLFVSDDAQLRDITFWMLGSVGNASWSSVAVVAPVVLLGGLFLVRLAPALDALCLGEAHASHLGVSVERSKRLGIVVTAVMVGTTVAFCGAIGFLGLVVPHLWRLLAGPRHRGLLLGSALLGSGLLLSADVVSRLAFAPAEMPVGVVTSFVGAPFFLWLLARRKA